MYMYMFVCMHVCVHIYTKPMSELMLDGITVEPTNVTMITITTIQNPTPLNYLTQPQRKYKTSVTKLLSSRRTKVTMLLQKTHQVPLLREGT